MWRSRLWVRLEEGEGESFSTAAVIQTETRGEQGGVLGVVHEASLGTQVRIEFIGAEWLISPAHTGFSLGEPFGLSWLRRKWQREAMFVVV